MGSFSCWCQLFCSFVVGNAKSNATTTNKQQYSNIGPRHEKLPKPPSFLYDGILKTTTTTNDFTHVICILYGTTVLLIHQQHNLVALLERFGAQQVNFPLLFVHIPLTSSFSHFENEFQNYQSHNSLFRSDYFSARVALQEVVVRKYTIEEAWSTYSFKDNAVYNYN